MFWYSLALGTVMIHKLDNRSDTNICGTFFGYNNDLIILIIIGAYNKLL